MADGRLKPQLVHEEVLVEDEPRGLPVDLGLVFLDPHDLVDRPRGGNARAGGLEDPLLAQLFFQLGGLLHAAAVHRREAVVQGGPVLGQRRHRHAEDRGAEGLYRVTGHLGRGFADHVLDGGPDLLGVHFHPARPGIDLGIVPVGLDKNFPFFVEDYASASRSCSRQGQEDSYLTSLSSRGKMRDQKPGGRARGRPPAFLTLSVSRSCLIHLVVFPGTDQCSPGSRWSRRCPAPPGGCPSPGRPTPGQRRSSPGGRGSAA